MTTKSHLANPPGRHHSNAARRHDGRPLRSLHPAAAFPAICLPPSNCHTPSALAVRGRDLAADVPSDAAHAPIRGVTNAPDLPRTAATRPGPLATAAPAVTHG